MADAKSVEKVKQIISEQLESTRVKSLPVPHS